MVEKEFQEVSNTLMGVLNVQGREAFDSQL